MEKITVYEKPTCTTCRKTIKLLQEKGYSFDRINYYIKPFSKNKLNTLLKKMNMKPSELLRKNEEAFKQLDIKNKKYSENQILEFMISDHNLIQRPIVEKGEKAILGRPVEKILELFD
ncbi:MAG: arsenate reductase [Ignavibacteriae bacterium HGW-Ignavibacteriae-2]|jgi:arsenate reductase|nr:Spx/MgsR family RNA polymerase-binding regulatory protein [Bacteroidota bacterium]PKL89342.1 MAG: arsenate reductase [Ignavibacteriae bacterium HGW-Ignavibacteriae-2]